MAEREAVVRESHRGELWWGWTVESDVVGVERQLGRISSWSLVEAIWVSSEASSRTMSVVGYEWTFTGRLGDGRRATVILRVDER